MVVKITTFEGNGRQNYKFNSSKNRSGILLYCAGTDGITCTQKSRGDEKQLIDLEWPNMATSSAWLNILIKRGQEIVVKCSWEDTFGSLLEKFGIKQTTIEKVQIANGEKFVDPVHIVPIDAPVSLCDQLKCMHVCISIKVPVRGPPTSETGRNAFNVLMASSREIIFSHHAVLSPPNGKELRKDQELYNDLLGRCISLLHVTPPLPHPPPILIPSLS